MLRLKRASDCNSTLTDVYGANDDPLASSRKFQHSLSFRIRFAGNFILALKEMSHLYCHLQQFKSIPTGKALKAATLK